MAAFFMRDRMGGMKPRMLRIAWSVSHFRSRVALRQILGNLSRSSRQLAEPRGKIDSCRRNFGRRRMFVFHDQMFPFTSRVVDLWGGVPDVLAPY
jgi:hypothetical protein